MTVPIIHTLALFIAGWLWIRGVWRACMSDCAVALCIAILWSLVLSVSTGSMKAINDLGICSVALAAVTLTIALLIPNRTKMSRPDVMLAGAAMRVTDVLLSILL